MLLLEELSPIILDGLKYLFNLALQALFALLFTRPFLGLEARFVEDAADHLGSIVALEVLRKHEHGHGQFVYVLWALDGDSMEAAEDVLGLDQLEVVDFETVNQLQIGEEILFEEPDGDLFREFFRLQDNLTFCSG